jgi:hypothetical protein
MGMCYQREEEPIDLVRNEVDLSEFIKKERFYLKRSISSSNRENKNSIDETDQPTNYKNITKLKGILSKLDGTFCQIVFDEVLDKLESRFKKEKYNDFDEVKNSFLEFYHKNKENYEYNSLMLNAEEYNEHLDKVRILKDSPSKI